MRSPDDALVALDASFRTLNAGRPQHGTSLHYPDCRGGGCTGCLPAVVEGEVVDGPRRFPRRPVDRFTMVREATRFRVPDVPPTTSGSGA